MNELMMKTCSTPEEIVVTTENYIPTENSEPSIRNTPKMIVK